MTENTLRRIVIVGGGSAGWMAAAKLSTTVDRSCAIELVESDEIGTVGVGEATIPPIKQFLSDLGVSEADFVRATRASFKLGIEFVGWGREGGRYFHPFGTYGIGFDVVPPYQHWLKARLGGDPTPLDTYSMAWAAASRGRFAHPVANPQMVQSTFDYAYHFDASLFARFLRTLAEQHGVTRTEGKVADIVRDPQSGRIAAVVLADGRRVEGGFFIDCTGFASLLLGRALDTPYEDWRHLLPCDRAIAVPSESNQPRPPFTRSTARAAGWQWRIPLQHRIGNGYVFASAHISEDEATATLLGGLDGLATAEPRTLKFVTGHRRDFWRGNCLALGLAAGFMEPLESTALHLVQTGIARFMALFPDAHPNDLAIAEYNRLTVEEYQRIRDFLVLHYHANQRRGAFWQACRDMELPETLAWRIAQFRRNGRIMSPGPELFQNPSWLAVMIGQDVIPTGYDPLIDLRPTDKVEQRMASLRTAMAAAAEEMPLHGDWLAQLSGE